MVASTQKLARQPTNAELAAALGETAGLLAAQFASPFRIAAYRRAAQVVRDLDRSVASIERELGIAGLLEIPGVGKSIARSLRQLVRKGRMHRLDELRQREIRRETYASLPGIGLKLAQRIRAALGIESLEEVHAAAYDGRLEGVPGVGRKRVQVIRECLAARLPHLATVMPPSFSRSAPPDAPSVATLLDIDREYRLKAQAGRLLRVAPHRFNPTGAAWLPILRTQREGRQYRAIYSNTARAHELAHTDDWVVIYRDEPSGGGQWTVVTGRFGPTRGQRIVRGREAECLDFHQAARGPALFD